MKVLKWLLILVVGLIIGVVLIGVFVPRQHYVSEILIDRSVETSFRIFNDSEQMGDWLEGFESIELVEGQEKEVGSKYKITVSSEGKTMIMDETLTAFEANEKVAIHLENEVMVSDNEVLFTDEDGKTRLHSEMTVEGANVFWRALFAFYKGTFEEQDKEKYEKLKTLIESSPLMILPDSTMQDSLSPL
jgi:hypothetical protein